MSLPLPLSDRAHQAYAIAASLTVAQQQFVTQAHLLAADERIVRPATPGEHATARQLCGLRLLDLVPNLSDRYVITPLGVLVVGALVRAQQPSRW